jgi:predicted AlkP superfamily pyrophosphatase or phosphodiesterase
MPAIINPEPRKIAPAVEVVTVRRDEREVIVEKMKKKLGDKSKGMHFFFGDANIAKTGRYDDEGYVACGVDHKGDPLFMRPMRLHTDHITKAAGDSVANKDAARTGESDEYQTRTAGGFVRPRPEKEE